VFPPNWTTTGAEWDSKAATVMSAFVTRAVSMGPASSPGNATVRRAGGGSSATKVRTESDKSSVVRNNYKRQDEENGNDLTVDKSVGRLKQQRVVLASRYV